MNDCNFTEIRMTKKDYFKLPPYMRKMTEGLMVLAHSRGGAKFIPVMLVNL
jgi:hypothetical protein